MDQNFPKVFEEYHNFLSAQDQQGRQQSVELDDSDNQEKCKCFSQRGEAKNFYLFSLLRFKTYSKKLK